MTAVSIVQLLNCWVQARSCLHFGISSDFYTRSVLSNLLTPRATKDILFL